MDKNIGRYKDRENNLIAFMELIYWSVRSFSLREGDGVKGLNKGFHYFSPLRENMKIWCNIQVIIYQLLRIFGYILCLMDVCHPSLLFRV